MTEIPPECSELCDQISNEIRSIINPKQLREILDLIREIRSRVSFKPAELEALVTQLQRDREALEKRDKN